MRKSTKSALGSIPSFLDGFLVDFMSQEESDRAQDTLNEIYDLAGRETFDLIINYLLSQVASGLLFNENSPLLKAVNEALEVIGHESNKPNEAASAQIRELKKVNAELSQQIVKLSAIVKPCGISLGLVRRRLKCPDVKDALDLSRVLNKQPSLTSVEQAVVNLANAIKDACTSIKNLNIE